MAELLAAHNSEPIMLTLPLLILVVGADPTITAFAGTGEKGFAGDGGPAEKAKLDRPFDVAFDKAGNLYFSDTFNHRIRRVDAKSGVISTVAGNGKKGFAGDGAKATDAMLNEPYGVCFDHNDNLYIVDRLNYCIRAVSAKTGEIRTIAGTGGKAGYGGDNGPATNALLREPNGICFDGDTTLYIADVADQRASAPVDVFRQTIWTVAGNGEKKSAGDSGPLKDATLAGPVPSPSAPTSASTSSSARKLRAAHRSGEADDRAVRGDGQEGLHRRRRQGARRDVRRAEGDRHRQGWERVCGGHGERGHSANRHEDGSCDYRRGEGPNENPGLG